ncbi:MAG: prepilin-type N-terminal cleavage/methylation domain-containing protein [Patescibacteria group bacterium]|nr:prepilin-type N-terminal cleavage/methylation domain-containing protein [Patescibacteria group bacterium]
MRKNRETRVNSGFTLIELLVVIGIVGVLSSIALVALNEARAKARYTSILSQLRQLGQAALMDITVWGHGLLMARLAVARASDSSPIIWTVSGPRRPAPAGRMIGISGPHRRPPRP